MSTDGRNPDLLWTVTRIANMLGQLQSHVRTIRHEPKLPGELTLTLDAMEAACERMTHELFVMYVDNVRPVTALTPESSVTAVDSAS